MTQAIVLTRQRSSARVELSERLSMWSTAPRASSLASTTTTPLPPRLDHHHRQEPGMAFDSVVFHPPRSLFAPGFGKIAKPAIGSPSGSRPRHPLHRDHTALTI